MFDHPANYCNGCNAMRRTVINQHCASCRRKACAHATLEVVAVIKVNGTRDLHERCEDCSERIRGVKHTDVTDPHLVPVIRDHRGSNPPCAHCGAIDTELHHYAPQALFPDANDWPTGYLCRLCHQTWHRVMRGATRATA